MISVPRITAGALAAVLLFCLADLTADAFEPDLDILKRALTKALGKETNTGRPRLAEIKYGDVGGEDVLVIALNANQEPTQAALRYGVFADAVKVLRILKSWDWPNRADRVMIGERIVQEGDPAGADRLLFSCVISSRQIRTIDWKSFDPRRLPEVAESAEFYRE